MHAFYGHHLHLHFPKYQIILIFSIIIKQTYLYNVMGFFIIQTP